MMTRRSTLLVLCVALAPAAAARGGDPVQVLFLGNSYTNSNGMPGLVEGLATSAGHQLDTTLYAPGGNTLGAPQGSGAAHASNATSLALIAQAPWDFVVLQDQSVLPTIPAAKFAYMIPGVESLDAAIEANDPSTVTLLFQTWGRQDGGQFCGWGGCSLNFPDFDSMQTTLTSSYGQAKNAVGATVAPVGEAWRRAFDSIPGLVLHVGDGSHPNLAGSYLAACVFYARIFDASPVGLTYTAGLDQALAADLQQAAAEAAWGPGCGYAEYGLPGTGANSLTIGAAGDPALGGTSTISASGLPASALGSWLLISAGEAELPLLGGTLHVDPATLLPFYPFITEGSGFDLALPADPSLTGAGLYFQSVSLDPDGAGGVAFSHGLRLAICP